MKTNKQTNHLKIKTTTTNSKNQACNLTFKQKKKTQQRNKELNIKQNRKQTSYKKGKK